MDPIISTITLIGSILFRKSIEKSGENIGDILSEAFLERIKGSMELLKAKSPDISQKIEAIEAREIEDQELIPNQYGQLANQIEPLIRENKDLQNAAEALVEAAKNTSSQDLAVTMRNIVDALGHQDPILDDLIASLERINPEELKSYLPDTNQEQVDRFAEQLSRLHELQRFFRKYRDEHKIYGDKLLQVRKTLDYKRPYRIAVIGKSGSGKSTMLNAMLGRDLLVSSEGQAVTGTALNIFLDGSYAGKEKAVVQYRNSENIRRLIRVEFFERYNLENYIPGLSSFLKDEIDEEFLKRFRDLPLESIDIEEIREQAIKSHTALVDVLQAFTRFSQDSLVLSLSDEDSIKTLNELINENSDANKLESNIRKIGLVQSVKYEIAPNEASFNTLKLPNNVCLVDLPGLGAEPLHDIIIRDGIKGADAVVLVLSPPRIELASDKYLLERVKQYISFDNNVESGERIFFVLNAVDNLLEKETEQDVHDLIERIVPGYTQAEFVRQRESKAFFTTSALAALLAQKKILNQEIDNEILENKYISFGEIFNLKDPTDQEILEASEVPSLVRELSRFARDRRIERQIDDSQKAISYIANNLYTSYQTKLKRIRDRVIPPSGSQIEKLLSDRKTDLKAEIWRFRSLLITEKFEKDWKEALQTRADKICSAIDKKLTSKMPEIWKNAFDSGVYRPAATFHPEVMKEKVLGNAEVYLWGQFSERIPELADDLVEKYRNEVKERRIAHKVEEYCLNHVKVIQVQKKIDNWVDSEMRTNMVHVAARIALAQATDRENRLIEFKESLIASSLENVPSERHVNDAKVFDNFIQAVRKHYANKIIGFCLNSLLNIQMYECLIIEERLFQYIDEQFREILKSQQEPEVKSTIDSLLGKDFELRELRILEQKIQDIRSLVSTVNSPDSSAEE